MSKELYKEAIDLFGINNQLKKFREEMLECLLALERYMNDKSLDKDALKSEIADVRITLSQAEMILFVNDREKNHWINKKQNKLRKHIMESRGEE